MSLKLEPAARAREAAIPLVSGRMFEMACIHAGKEVTATFAPEKTKSEK